MKLSNKIMVSSWMGDPMVCIYSSWNFFQVEFFEVNFRWNFAVNPFRFFGKISTWKKIPGGKICIFRLILLLYIAFHLYSISCEQEKNPPVIFLRFHVFKFTWIPAGPFRTGSNPIYLDKHPFLFYSVCWKLFRYFVICCLF